MSIARHHAEWLKLIETSGPFLSLPILQQVFPQGLIDHDSELSRRLRLAQEEWREGNHRTDANTPLHRRWIEWVLKEILEFDSAQLAEGQSIPQTLKAPIPQHGETLRPDVAVLDANGSGKPRLLISTYPPNQDLERPVAGRVWKASPATRMMDLLHGSGCLLGLVTNGESWMLVFAKPSEATGFASWYAEMWLEEPLTLRAFRSLLASRRFFAVAEGETPEALLTKSAENQQGVTEQLGLQVRRAVEVLVESLDRADRDSKQGLLKDVAETALYEASLSVMMRLVFLLCAEERGLLPLTDPIYNQFYAASTLQAQLREAADQHGEEVLERRFDAWCRLLATFRAVHGGAEHDQLSLPAYGGHLFDPDRFPFLEGRPQNSRWQDGSANPLPVNNRTVLHLLEALQFLTERLPGGGPAERRRLSFRSLDIEQIGHVYEGLLDHTAKRASEVMLGLAGSKDKEPEISLSEMERLRTKSLDVLVAFLKEETGRSESALSRAVEDPSLGLDEIRLRTACGNQESLFQRVRPFAALIRSTTFGQPVVIHPGSVYVTTGTDRRTSGTQYTPRILTESVVQYALEPQAYEGPAQGKPPEQWTLKSASRLLGLKVCDPSVGSGAFLVQACRYLSELLVEAWERAEKDNPGSPRITPEGHPSIGDPSELLIPKEIDERLIFAQRLIAQRCLYGVDRNPLAVEMAKLSLWLLTLDKNKPFTFLDHAIKCGDSLVGVDLEQLQDFSLARSGEPKNYLLFLKQDIKEMADLRWRIGGIESSTVADVRRQERLLNAAEKLTRRLRWTADWLISAAFQTGKAEKRDAYVRDASIELSIFLRSKDDKALEEKAQHAIAGRKPFHWPIEFPEVFVDRDGFDAIIGNPPFMGGQKITGALGREYREYLVGHLGQDKRGSADVCAYFFLRAFQLLKPGGSFGLLATNTIAQGDTREVGLDQLVDQGAVVVRAVPSRKWPGQANLEVAHVWGYKGEWKGSRVLDEQPVHAITSQLTVPGEVSGKPFRLAANANMSFQGSIVLGMGFVLEPEEALRLIEKDPRNKDVLYPYINGEDLNSRPDQSPSRWVINFQDWPLKRELDARWADLDGKEQKAMQRSGVVTKDYPEPVAEDRPDCLAVVEEKVRPERESKMYSPSARRRWWSFERWRPELYAAIADMERVLVIPETTKYCAFTICETGLVFSHMTKVIAIDSTSAFALLASSIHEIWGRQYSSTLETRLKYIISDAFETFPFPEAYDAGETGSSYHLLRKQIMRDRQEGLTAIYNRFHNPKEHSADIGKLRNSHAAMDHVILKAYQWKDLILDHSFYETNQGIRYTINPGARHQLLDRLLHLNHERYREEVAAGLHEKDAKKRSTAKKRKVASKPTSPTLFGD